jgi:hypothetical protein
VAQKVRRTGVNTTRRSGSGKQLWFGGARAPLLPQLLPAASAAVTLLPQLQLLALLPPQ